MTQATDTDIRELKTAIATLSQGIDGNTRSIEVIGRSTEAIADLTLEKRVGFERYRKKVY